MDSLPTELPGKLIGKESIPFIQEKKVGTIVFLCFSTNKEIRP